MKAPEHLNEAAQAVWNRIFDETPDASCFEPADLELIARYAALAREIAAGLGCEVYSAADRLVKAQAAFDQLAKRAVKAAAEPPETKKPPALGSAEG